VLFASLCLALIPAFLPAQDADRVSMKIDVVAWGNDIGGLSFKSGNKEGPITAQAFTYSEPVSYSGPRILEIHQSGDGVVQKERGPSTPEDKEHESIPLPASRLKTSESSNSPIPAELAKRRKEDDSIVALAALPRDSRRATVLLAPAAEGTYQAFVIDDDPSRLPIGKLRVHNLAPMPIAMQFSGGQKAEMKPRDSFLVHVAKGQTVYQLAYQSSNRWKIQENNIIPVRPNEQTHLIVLKSTNQYFLSADGASGGYLQTVILRRSPESAPAS
jgi:hypothetical protein